MGENDTKEFINELSENTLDKNGVLIIDAGTIFDNMYQDKDHYVAVRYKIFDKDNNLLGMTPKNITATHRYPNKLYMCLTEKLGRKHSINGCYHFDTIENLNKIDKIEFSLFSSSSKDSEKESKCFTFYVKPNYKKAGEYAFISFHINVDTSGIYFKTDDNVDDKNNIMFKFFDKIVNDEREIIDENTAVFKYRCELITKEIKNSVRVW